MFADTEQVAADLAAMDEPERERAYARVHQWFADNHDKITHHVHLMPPESATTVRLDQGEPLITDGPYVEGKEREKLALVAWPAEPQPDDRLRLMFTCCHPALPRTGQVALTLRVACGLTTAPH